MAGSSDDYGELFKLMDKNGDGVVTLSEMRGMLKSLGIYKNEKELKKIYKEADRNGDGRIELDELITSIENRKKKSQMTEDDRTRKMFRMFDGNGDGFISRHELKKHMSNIGVEMSDEEVDAVMQQIDADGNCQIDYEEFKNLMSILNGDVPSEMEEPSSS